MNTVVLVGRCSKKNEMYYSNNGKPNIRINIAVQRDIKTQDGQNETFFFPCIIWNSSATFANQYIEVGDLIAITGRLQINEWNDEQGIRHSVTEINVDKIEILVKKNNNQQPAQNQNSQPMNTGANPNINGYQQSPQYQQRQTAPTQPNPIYQNGNMNYQQNQSQQQYANNRPQNPNVPPVPPTPYPQGNQTYNNQPNTPPQNEPYRIDVQDSDLPF